MKEKNSQFDVKIFLYDKKGHIKMLILKNIKKDYATASETVHALKGVSIAFRKTEFVSILGPSGCGKTTLLNLVGGLDHYTDGDMVIGERSTKNYRDKDWDVYRNHRVGFIFQSYNLIPHQTILGNVELALTIGGIGKEERTRRAKEVLDRVGLKDQYDKKPNQLSGGQCQRVAIARALVNNPEILLADEPTGALDTVTSVQIMELIKEISKERLVIMVTHNPALAMRYSTRIVRLLDGEVTEDTNPMTDEEIAAEARAIGKEKKKRRRREKAKMSLFTAFKLSAKNLFSKRGRTALVGFAGSIGIIGIALVLAFSAGIKGYIKSMQDDMLSGNPISITETAYDLDALTGIMNNQEKAEVIEKLEGHIYVSSIVEYLAKMNKDVSTVIMENEINRDYIEYVKAMPEEYYNAMLLSYGINPSLNIFTDFDYLDTDSVPAENISVKSVVDIYTSILKETDFKDYASYVGGLVPSFKQAPNNVDYLMSQYDLVGEMGKIASEKDEVMLVLNSDDELSDLLLAMLGYYDQMEFQQIVNKATESEDYDRGLYRDSFTYDELLGKTFTWYPNDTVFTEGGIFGFNYNYNSKNFAAGGNAVTLKVVGILTTKQNVNYGSLTSGIYYTEALTNHMLEVNKDCNFIDFLNNETASATLAQMFYRLPYSYEYRNWEGKGKNGTGTIQPSMSMEDIMSSMTSMMPGIGEGEGSGAGSGTGGAAGGVGTMIDGTDLKNKLIRSIGGNDLASSVLIYPLSFDEKDYVTEYLDAWNGDGNITVGDKLITKDDRNDITYTDALELVISIINTMIDVVSYALIAFTSVSLVVSTVMIGIITYVSVVERIKEIGVIRSLGGRKRDVSHLFNAETFIIGSLAGIFGIIVTYIISFIVSLILAPLINYMGIAKLPFEQALLLIGLSILLTLISGLIPSRSAARKDPVVALRTE